MNDLRRAVETKLFHSFGLAGAVACAALLLAPAPALAATITVNTTADGAGANDGVCTLREAIIAANTNTASGAMAGECVAGAAGLDTIAFAIPGAGVRTIALASPLPAITEAVFINGYTQPGSSPNTNALDAGINAVLLIELNGDVAGGLTINAAGSVIRGLNIHGLLGDQITVNASNVTIAGNFLGTNPAGTAATGGSGSGIRLSSGDNGIIGGPAAADRNLVSGDTAGPEAIFLTAGNGTTIQGNFVGTDVTGTLALNVSAFNSPVGITIHSPASNTAILGNLISGNSGGGADLIGGGAVQGNLIGTQRDGVSALANSNFGGINLNGTGFLIGGTGLGQSNAIAFNAGVGVRVQNNALGHTITGNSIFSNTMLGIGLSSANTPLANDPCDVDTLPGNQGQNYPVITSAVIAGGNVTISGTLNSSASTDFHLEFFSNVACDPSGNGEGQTFLGSADVTTPVGSCDVSFGPLVFAVPPGQTVFTATASDFSSTSEFSACFAAGAPPTPTPTPTATPTPTVVATPTVAPTPTAGGPGNGASNVPALSEGMMALMGLALVGAALTLLKRAT